MKPDSIILDIDGTLWNSTPVVAKAWNEGLSQYPEIDFRYTAEMLTKLFGLSMTEIADTSLPFLTKEKRYALMEVFFEKEDEALEASDEDLLYPDVADTIRKLSETYKLFIVSNCQSGYIEVFLKKTGLDPYITDFECPGHTGRTKGQNIRLVADRNHLKNPVYVGDIARDHEASKEAGIPFCHAAYGFGEANDPDYVIQSFSELLTIF